MRAYLALIKIDIKLALRDRSVIFFNYLFPLIFFFVFAEMMGASRSGGISNVVTMVLTIGILGNGLWGAGMRAVQEREMNILRRFKVTPISPAPILLASMVTGWLIYLPAVLLICTLAHFLYGMAIPERWLSLLGLISLGVFAFRSIGLILASIVNSTQESTIAIQLLYMPMLFLSGATLRIGLRVRRSCGAQRSMMRDLSRWMWVSIRPAQASRPFASKLGPSAARRGSIATMRPRSTPISTGEPPPGRALRMMRSRVSLLRLR